MKLKELNKHRYKFKEDLNDVEPKAREILDPVQADVRKQMIKTDKIKKDLMDKTFKDITDKNVNNNRNFNPKRTIDSKKMFLSENLFEALSNEDKLINGQFSNEDLIKLRNEIVLNSVFTKDYENSFNIDPDKLSNFFFDYVDYYLGDELEDTSENLINYYNEYYRNI